MKPRILHVIDHTNGGGAQVVLAQIIRTLSELFSFAVAVLNTSGKYSEAYEALGAPVYHLGNRGGKWNPLTCITLQKIVGHERFDLIHSHLFKANILGTIAGMRARCKTILHDHSAIHPRSLKNRCYFSSGLLRHSYLAAYRLALRFGDRVIVLTPDTLDLYIKSHSVDPKKLVLLPNGVDISRFACHKRLRSTTLADSLGLPPETKLVTMIARLEPEKDWGTFLQVAEEFKRSHDRSCAFLVVGEGSEEQRLRNWVLERCLHNVVFLGHRDDIPYLLAQSDVFVLTSRNEPFGLALLEAMAAGRPVIATRSEGPESIITNEIDGLLVPVGDAEALVSHINHLLNDNAFGRNLGCRARQTVQAKYSLSRFSEHLADIYDELLRS